jgi:hypothetical protein
MGGNIDGKNVTNAPNEEILGYRSGLHGAAVVEGVATHKPLSGGEFARMREGLYVTRRIAESLAGVDNDVLLSGASDFGRRSIHFLESNRRIDIVDWSYITGEATFGGSEGDLFNYHNIRGSGDIDDAAHPTRAVPGELVYTDTHLAIDGVPKSDVYKPKTG